MLPSPIIFNRNINPNLHTEYDRFEEAITKHTTSGAWANQMHNPNLVSGNIAVNKWTAVTIEDMTGRTMVGSSWAMNCNTPNSAMIRVIQHMYPDIASFNLAYQRKDKLLVLRNGVGSVSRFEGINRNGYWSAANGSGGNAVAFQSMVFYDPTLYRCRVYNGWVSRPTYTDYIF